MEDARPATRLFVADELAADAAVRLTDGQAHQLRHVLRRGPGDVVALFNGRDGEWLGRIEALGKAGGSARAARQLRPQAEAPGPLLLFAPVKRQRIDFLVEKATELGVAALQPVWTERTEVERLNLERLQAHATEAAEQSERLSVPPVRAPLKLAEALRDWPAGRTLLVCDERGAAPSLGEILERHAPVTEGSEDAALLVGPEGGFTERELDALAKLHFVTPVGLGPRVLRAETAALAALAVYQARSGDWRRPRHRRDSSGAP